MYTKHFSKGFRSGVHDVQHILDLSEVSKYWIGYIFANANYNFVRGQVKGLRVLCTQEEVAHLSTLSEYLGYSSHATKASNKSSSYSLSLYTSELVTLLQHLGLTQHMQDRNITDDVYARDRHFWRGYADGNGLLDDSTKVIQFRLQAPKPMFDDFLFYTQQSDAIILHHAQRDECILTDGAALAVIRTLYAHCSIASPRMWNVAYQYLTENERAAEASYTPL